jgi:opacity protein-like surface antigen
MPVHHRRNLIFIALTLSACVGVARSQTGTEKQGSAATEFCWRDSATGNYIPTTPIGASPQDYVPGDKHWENPRNGKTYVHLPDGSWIDAKTGNPVPTEPLGASPIDFIPGETHWENPRNGKTYFRVPCPPPTPSTTNPPAPPPSTVSTPTPVRTPTYSGVYLGVGGSLGITGHTTTYDDNYKIGGPGIYTHGYGFITGGLGKKSGGISAGYLSLIVGVTAPTNTSTREDADSHLKFVGTVSGEIGFPVGKLPDGSPFIIYVNAGPAFGVESSGSSATISGTNYSYSDTEKMFGFTTGCGVKISVTPQLRVLADVEYLHLNETSFASPSGDYSLNETSIIGSVGVEWTFHKQPK